MVEVKQACIVLMLMFYGLTHATESDINCYICKFNGVSFWHDEENRVLAIELGGFGLEGEFPIGVKQCSSLQSLSLKGNKLSGTLPSDFFSSLQMLTTLDLSNNRFSGEIPSSLSDLAAYITILLLDHNLFTGHIPSGLALSQRLDQFSVSHNRLQGPIPKFVNGNFSPSSFEDNQDLCGFPLDPCPPDEDSVFHIATIIAACAAAVFLPVGAVVGWFCI
ncbi:unnamed protein product [Cochlearia groenlandica]